MITGTPGVGKTVVSSRLATKLGAFHIDLADIIKRENLTGGYDKRRRIPIADMGKLTRRVGQIVKQSRCDVVIDGHFAATVTPKAQVTRVFVLRCHPEKLKQRMERRGFRGSKLWENLEAEILDICLYEAIKTVGDEKVCEVDTTSKNSENVADEILSILHGKKPCTVGTTDWLGTLEKDNILDKYLKQF